MTCSNPMKEVLLTKKFLSSVSVIRNKTVNADDEELIKVIHLCIDMFELELTNKIGDIEVARLGNGLELSIYFIVKDRVVGSRENKSTIKKYAFLLAIADDSATPRCDPQNNTGMKLLKAAHWAAIAMSAVSTIRTLARKFKEIAEFIE